jgi:hypothetical protein
MKDYKGAIPDQKTLLDSKESSALTLLPLLASYYSKLESLLEVWSFLRCLRMLGDYLHRTPLPLL